MTGLEYLFRAAADEMGATTDTLRAMANRQACARDGHRYRVHGKSTPTKLTCTRCGVSWAIGARTEPS